jgi:hypothetical protein
MSAVSTVYSTEFGISLQRHPAAADSAMAGEGVGNFVIINTWFQKSWLTILRSDEQNDLVTIKFVRCF